MLILSSKCSLTPTGRDARKRESQPQGGVYPSGYPGAESEFHATAKSAMEGIGMITMTANFDDNGIVRRQVDASAAVGSIQRNGTAGEESYRLPKDQWLDESGGHSDRAFVP